MFSQRQMVLRQRGLVLAELVTPDLVPTARTSLGPTYRNTFLAGGQLREIKSRTRWYRLAKLSL